MQGVYKALVAGVLFYAAPSAGYYHAILDLDPISPRLKLASSLDEVLGVLSHNTTDCTCHSAARDLKQRLVEESRQAACKYIARQFQKNERSNPEALGDLCADEQMVDNPLEGRSKARIWRFTLVLGGHVVGQLKLKQLSPQKIALVHLKGRLLQVRQCHLTHLELLDSDPGVAVEILLVRLLTIFQDHMPVFLRPMGLVWPVHHVPFSDKTTNLAGLDQEAGVKILSQLGFVEGEKGIWCRLFKEILLPKHQKREG
ncbi:MAG: hypothetical protein ACK5O7_02000 [Holosporales bacterium]